jgi:hypothetical protein
MYSICFIDNDQNSHQEDVVVSVVKTNDNNIQGKYKLSYVYKIKTMLVYTVDFLKQFENNFGDFQNNIMKALHKVEKKVDTRVGLDALKV